jgi:hypothetical protein
MVGATTDPGATTVVRLPENLFVANALTFASLPLGIAAAFGSRWSMRMLGNAWILLGAGTVLFSALAALPMFDQDVAVPLALYAPVNLACALVHVGLRRAAKRVQPTVRA